MCCGDNKDIKLPEDNPKVLPSERKAMYCVGCGLDRIIPLVEVGEEFHLVPCPRCGVGFRGRLEMDGVREIL